MSNAIEEITSSFKKKSVVNVRSGDTVRVHQRIKEGNKERVQVFQGLVIKTSKSGGHQSRILVRRIASGIGVEKSFLVHSPLVVKIEVTKRSKVRRNYLSYMRNRTGKSARLAGVGFDKVAVNTVEEENKEDAASTNTEPVDAVIESDEPKSEVIETIEAEDKTKEKDKE